MEGYLKFLPEYEIHLNKNSKSLLARIYGVYTIKMNGLSKVNLILMANTLLYKEESKIERVFDLKGSWVGREVKITTSTKRTATLKDKNFLKIKSVSDISQWLLSDIVSVRNIIKEDCEFLSEMMRIDYSLLFAIEKIGKATFGREGTLALT